MSDIDKKKIIIIEDDDDIRELVMYALASAGFECDGFDQPSAFFETKEKYSEPPCLILLDIMLPDTDGLSILKILRDDKKYKDVPIIMLTAKSSETDKVKGLNFGADDYVTKPFGVTELIARINAVLRRVSREKPSNIVSFDNIYLDVEKHIITVNGAQISLTYIEFELLYYFMLNSNIVLSREKLMNTVWGYDYGVETRTVDMHITTLRKKLGEAGSHIITVRNVGYKLGD